MDVSPMTKFGRKNYLNIIPHTLIFTKAYTVQENPGWVFEDHLLGT